MLSSLLLGGKLERSFIEFAIAVSFSGNYPPHRIALKWFIKIN